MDPLDSWGWNDFYRNAYEAQGFEPEKFCPGRVLSQREDTFTLITPGGLRWAHPAGVLFHKKRSGERPGVGDWVVLERIDCPVTDERNKVTVTHSLARVLPRRSCFIREASGGRGEAQIVATNVDKIFVVNPVDDLNLNRIERFVVAIVSGGAIPAIVLSKDDLVHEEERREARARLREVFEGLEVLTTGEAFSDSGPVRKIFDSVLERGKTYALVGASGVGKSTLVNALLDEERQETGAVREGDGKGRHVTSFRELFALPNGALLMDTPGVREFAMWSQGDGLAEVFADIVDLEQGCRFRDCSHRTEPGCQIREAVERGEVTERRLQNWRTLSLEIHDNVERQKLRESKRERSDLRRKKKRDKRFSKPNR